MKRLLAILLLALTAAAQPASNIFPNVQVLTNLDAKTISFSGTPVFSISGTAVNAAGSLTASSLTGTVQVVGAILSASNQLALPFATASRVAMANSQNNLTNVAITSALKGDGTQAAASDLSNGTTGTGNVVLAGSPTITGTANIATGAIATGTIGTLTVTNGSTLAGAVTAASVVATNTSTFQGTANIATGAIATLTAGTVTLTNSPTLNGAAINMTGQAAETVGMVRQTTGNTAGNTLTVISGGATSGATDKGAGDLILSPGLSTGVGRNNVRIVRSTTALSTGTGDNTQVDGNIVCSPRSISNNSGTAMANFTLASNTSIAGNVMYSVRVFNGTDLQVEVGQASYCCQNKGGVFSGNTVVKYGNQQNMTSGTLTVTWTITGANPAVLTVNANSSLTPNTGYPVVTMTIDNLSGQAVAVQ